MSTTPLRQKGQSSRMVWRRPLRAAAEHRVDVTVYQRVHDVSERYRMAHARS
jgi:hypothetical protein